MSKYTKYCLMCNKEFITNRVNNKFCCEKCRRKYYRKQNKEYIAQYRKVYNIRNSEHIKNYNKEYNKIYYNKNKEHIKQYRKQNYIHIKEYNNKYKVNKYNTDLKYKLTIWSREQVRRCLSSSKTKHTFDILGYTPEQLKQRLEMNFKSDMTWYNHGTLWHIDHRKPLCKFNFVLPDGTLNYEQIRLANSLANLQPLYVTENLSKGGR